MKETVFQLITGVVVIIVGILVILKTNMLFPFSEGFTFKHVALYFIAVMLIGGGG
jgi:low affinity Fe/Cu permease